MAEFMKSASERGPTAARGCYDHLLWMGKLLRVNLRVTHPLVEPFRRTPKGHKPTQARVVSVHMLAHMEKLVMSENVFVSHAAAELLLVAYGAVRWAHLQRSVLVGEAELSFTFKCVRGKSFNGAAFV